MAIGKPVLCFAPEASHLGELIAETGCGWRFAHGDVDGVVKKIRELEAAFRKTTIAAADMAPRNFIEVGKRGLEAVKGKYSEVELRRRFCDVLEGVVTANDGFAFGRGWPSGL